MLSKKAQLLKPSPTLAMAAKARELSAAGHDVVSLTVGEPDWPTFDVANQAAISAIQAGFTKYTATQGIIELREEIAKSTLKLLHVQYSAKDITVGAGAKFILFSALQMLLDPGDEVIIPAPYWVSYPAMTELAGGVSKVVECGEQTNFKMTARQLEEAITAKTKCLILCSPSNPTGMMYSKKELAEIAAVIKKHPKLFVLSDDIYNRLVFNGEAVAPHLFHVDPSLKDQVLVVNGASKSYSMTGWRVGWALGPSNLIQAMNDFMSQSTSNVTSISQKATLAALQKGEPDIAKAVQALTEKCQDFSQKLSTIKGLKVYKPDGAFYLWVGVKDLIENKKLKDSKELADILLQKYYLATVPGIEFGLEGYLRISFAASKSSLDKAFDRLRMLSMSSNI